MYDQIYECNGKTYNNPDSLLPPREKEGFGTF
jgi:hypothetical protein